MVHKKCFREKKRNEHTKSSLIKNMAHHKVITSKGSTKNAHNTVLTGMTIFNIMTFVNLFHLFHTKVIINKLRQYAATSLEVVPNFTNTILH
jgi:hypothetical protein